MTGNVGCWRRCVREAFRGNKETEPFGCQVFGKSSDKGGSDVSERKRFCGNLLLTTCVWPYGAQLGQRTHHQTLSKSNDDSGIIECESA